MGERYTRREMLRLSVVGAIGAVALGNAHLTKVAYMLNSHLTGLLAYLRHRRTNAMAESLNSRIQHIKACAHGFRRFDSYRIAILFFLGKLALYPHKSP